MVLLVMDVKGLKLDVIRTAKLHATLYMNTVEWMGRELMGTSRGRL